MEKHSKQLVEVWGDTVAIGDLLKSLFICTSTTMGVYFLAPNHPPFPLIGGLLGAIIGFILCSCLFHPKRKLVEWNSGKEKDE
jgi:hypothetical protein